MVFICMDFVSCVVLAVIIFMVEARSVWPPTKDQKSPLERKLWSPKDVSRDDWLRCHGLPCDKWEQRQRKMMILNKLSPGNRAYFPDVDGSDHMALQSANFDGCIWYTEAQIDEMIHELNSTTGDNIHSRQKRKLDSYAIQYKWDMPIRFKFDGAHTSSEKELIRSAFRDWERDTCVRFEEIGLFARFNTNHLILTRELTGCHSWVGKMYSYPQQVNLQSQCLNNIGIPIHEIGHALGLWHEQQRRDRDEYINVNYENLGAYYGQFLPKNTNSLGVKYDLGSIMHYGPKDGSSNGKKVLEAKDPLYQSNMGQRTGLSYNDAKIVNKLYCDNTCGIPLSRPCQYGGYQNPNDCSRCKCPPGFGGTYCEGVGPSVNGNCGGEINLQTGDSVYIESPGYSTDGYYPNLMECNWHVKAPSGYNVQMSFEGQFGLLCFRLSECYHWLEVKYKGNLGDNGPRFCCNRKPDAELVSDQSMMVLAFRTNFKFDFKLDRRGFRVKLKAVPGTPGSVTPLVTDPTTPTRATTTKITTTKATTTTTKPTTTTKRTTSTTRPTTTTTRTTTTTTNPTTTTTKASTTTERTSNTKLECINVDLTFLLDSSGSVGLLNWYILTNFVTDITQLLEISNDCAKIGVVTYGNDADINIPFNYQYSKEKMIQTIAVIEFKNQYTNTGAALSSLLTSLYKEENGERRSAANVTIIITDGESNKGTNAVLKAKEVREKSIEILGIGVGPYVNKKELESITGSVNNVEYINSFDKLVQEDFISNSILKIKDAASQQTSVTITPSTTHSTTPTPSTTFIFECTFETSNGEGTFCDMIQSQSDKFDWYLNKGKTPSQPTGPISAKSGSYYIYIEATGRVKGDNARILLPQVSTSGTYCLSFYYNMFGHHIYQLNVYIRDTSNQDRLTVWKKVGEQGADWFDSGILMVQMRSYEQIVFEGVRGEAFSGDIALDNIKLTQC